MTMKHMKLGAVAVFVAVAALVLAQPLGRRPARQHTMTQKGELRLVPATEAPPSERKVTITVEGHQRVIRANGVPNHKTGRFPNPGNPNPVRGQSYAYRIPASPKPAAEISPLGMHNFGIAVNGVPFDPGAAEFYLGRRGSKWMYEPLSGAIRLGIDASHAHVQPTGAYHYHGLPTGLLDEVKLDPKNHSPLIGWAADGFPMYAVYGYSDAKDSASTIKPLKSSYRLKQGERPGGDEPTGPYDGAFVADYEYAEGAGDLDACNGRECVTPDFPKGTYAYFLTEDWPVIPRNYRGTPSRDFVRRGPPAR